MNQLVIIAIPVSFLIINGPLLKRMFSKKPSYNQKMRADICLGEKPDYCPTSSYKQCIITIYQLLLVYVKSALMNYVHFINVLIKKHTIYI